jgi:hypothetical protein
MGYSGLIYAAIVAAWAAFLVPKWVRRNEEVERAREVDQERGVRVLSPRRGRPPQAPHGAVAVPSVAAEMARNVEPDVFAEAARRRRRMLTLLTVLLVVSVGLVVAGRAPAWIVAGPGVLLCLFLFVARRAAVTQARRQRIDARRRAADRRRAKVDEAGAVWAAPSESEESGQRRLVLPDEVASPTPAAEGDEWSPVPVPLPTYLTKPKATRPAARKIDLSQPGSWTSGRLDPASSIQLPHRAPAEQPPASVEPEVAAGDDEVIEEPRRAVGD